MPDPGGTYDAVMNGIPIRDSDGLYVTEAPVDNLIGPALNQITADVSGTRSR